MRLDDLHSQKSCLVSSHVQMGRKLRQRMRQMPTKQSTHTLNYRPTIQNQCSTPGPTIQSSSHGPSHPTPQQQWIQRHSYHCRSWLHQSSTIPTLHHKYNRRKNCQTLSGQCVSMVRNSLQNHIGQRPQVYIPLLNLTMSTHRDRSKHINSLSPTN